MQPLIPKAMEHQMTFEKRDLFLKAYEEGWSPGASAGRAGWDPAALSLAKKVFPEVLKACLEHQEALRLRQTTDWKTGNKWGER